MDKITYADIKYRKRSLLTESENAAKNCDLCYKKYEDTKSELAIKNFVSECALDSKTASSWFPYLLECVKESKDEKTKRIFADRVLPLIESDIISEDTEMPDEWKNIVRKNEACDRVIKNHGVLQKKLDLENLSNVSSNLLTDYVCHAVGKYKNLNVIGKLNVAVEEAVYIHGEYGVEMVEESVVDRICRYFIIREQLSKEENSDILVEMTDSLNSNDFITYHPKSSKIGIDEFLLGKEKSMTDLKGLVGTSVNLSRKEFIMDEVADIFSSTIIGYPVDEEAWRIDTPVRIMLEKVVPHIGEAIEEHVAEISYTQEYLVSARKAIKSYMEDAKYYANHFPCKEGEDSIRSRYQAYTESLQGVLDHIIFLEDTVYPKDTMQCLEGVVGAMKAVSKGVEISGTLVDVLKKVSKVKGWLDTKVDSSGMLKNAKKGIKKIFNKVLSEDSPITEFMTPDGIIDVVVETFQLLDSELDKDVHDIFDRYCKQINNNVLSAGDQFKAYYTATNNLVEVHLVSLNKFELMDEEYQEYIEHDMSSQDINYVYEMMRYGALDESLIISPQEAADYFIHYEDEAMNEFGTFLEMAGYAALDEEYVTEVYRRVAAHYGPSFKYKWSVATESYQAYPGLDTESILESLDLLFTVLTETKMSTATRAKIKRTKEDNKREAEKNKNKTYGTEPAEKEEEKTEVEESLRYGDYAYLLGISEAKKIKAPDPKKDLKAKEKEKKKEEKAEAKAQKAQVKAQKNQDKAEKSLAKLNDLKLFAMGLKEKMRKMNAKEQKLCRDLDSGAERLVKSIKQALISDRREAIIKGSVIPSFSKSIKTGIALAGTSLINPLAPVIAAVGAFAISKKLTKKERVLLLDDIEIELRIIEKEISNAENNNQTKKMRALMKEQRNLQRQYQRIKYNIRVGKDIIPGGSTVSGGD